MVTVKSERKNLNANANENENASANGKWFSAIISFCTMAHLYFLSVM